MLPPLARFLVALLRAGRPATHVWLAATAVTLALPVAPAHAQLLKRIKQAAAEKAADAAGRKVLGEEAKDSTPPAASGAAATPRAASRAGSSAAPTRSSGPSKLEITPERVTQFLVAMEPAVAAAKERAAHAVAEKKLEDYHKCMALAGQKQTEAMMKGQATSPTKAQQAEIDRLLDLGGDLVQQMLAATQAGDTTKARILSDSSVAVSTRANAMLNPFIGKMCGTTVPPKPGQLDESRLRDAEKPRKIDGWSETQFGLMRERIALHFLAPEKSGLAPEERAAVDARRADFAVFVAAWKSHAQNWATWSDVYSAWQNK
jgi:hypothetical protein